MRTVSALLAAAALVLLPALPAAAAGTADGERITSYGVDLTVRPDGSMQVRETIAYDFGGNARHGIEREIDTEQKHDGKHNRRFPVSAVTTSPGPVEVLGGNALTTVRIGDPTLTVTGRQTYTISYTVAAATTHYDDRDELYWNAVGPGWSVPVSDVTVRVSGAEVTRSACFAGEPGGKAPCASAEGGSFSQPSLAAGEALTVVAAFPAGSVATAAPILVDRQTLGRYFAGNPAVAVPGVLLALGGPVWFLVATVRRKRAREAPGLPYRQQFQPQPPAGMRPLFVNTLLGGMAKPADAVAVLLDLSARGFVSVTPEGKDWRLVAVRAPDASVPPEGHEVFQAAFRNGPDTTLRAAAKPVRQVGTRLANMAKDGVVEQGWFSRRPAGNGMGWWMALAIFLFLAGIPVAAALAIVAHAGIVGAAVLLGGIVLMIGAALRSEPRTEAGEIARSQLMAFRDTIGRIDPGRLPPDQREAVLGGLLPYAVVLGLAPQLAAAFSAAGVVAGGYAYAANPMWWSTFSSDAVHSTTPSSSSSGGGSGFSGSSGGGGGGGGGGSW